MQEFSYQELEEATDSFSESRIIGKGSHGKVYRGVLKDGKMVAIKKQSLGLEKLQDNSKLQNEAHILTSISHKNNPFLINILGTTSSANSLITRNPEPLLIEHNIRQTTPNQLNLDGKSRTRELPITNSANLDQSPLIIVMEYMANGTLHELLHATAETPFSPPPPPWPRRAQIILQIGKAIQTLHEETEHVIIHRDIKSSNILLDENFDAKLADFGLAVRLNKNDEDNHHRPAGTMGYLDPCYTKPRKLSKKTDIFSYGVLILEIISGRKVIDVSKTPCWIVDWGVQLIEHCKEEEVLDGRTMEPNGTIKRFLNIAARCVCSKPEVRPSIGEIVLEMEMVMSNSSLDHVKSWSIRFCNNVLVNLLRSFVVLRNRKKKGKMQRKKNVCTSNAIFDASIGHVDKSSSKKLLMREILADITLK